jgi:hypothetical protein
MVGKMAREYASKTSRYRFIDIKLQNTLRMLYSSSEEKRYLKVSIILFSLCSLDGVFSQDKTKLDIIHLLILSK